MSEIFEMLGLRHDDTMPECPFAPTDYIAFNEEVSEVGYYTEAGRNPDLVTIEVQLADRRYAVLSKGAENAKSILRSMHIITDGASRQITCWFPCAKYFSPKLPLLEWRTNLTTFLGDLVMVAYHGAAAVTDDDHLRISLLANDGRLMSRPFETSPTILARAGQVWGQFLYRLDTEGVLKLGAIADAGKLFTAFGFGSSAEDFVY